MSDALRNLLHLDVHLLKNKSIKQKHRGNGKIETVEEGCYCTHILCYIARCSLEKE